MKIVEELCQITAFSIDIIFMIKETEYQLTKVRPCHTKCPRRKAFNTIKLNVCVAVSDTAMLIENKGLTEDELQDFIATTK